jgi:nucleoside-diphosphate-sugar epimerase
MKLLVTGANHSLVRNIITFLLSSHQVRALDARLEAPLPDGVEAHTFDLRTLGGLDALVAGIDAILHFAPISLVLESDINNLEHTVRGSYHLVKAARNAGVKQIVVASSQSLFASLDATFRVTSTWRPRPQPTIADLCAWLSECLFCEEARTAGMGIACLRLGKCDNDVDFNHVLQCIVKLANSSKEEWHVLHVGARESASLCAAPPPANRLLGKVVIFGAGGPLAATTAQLLKDRYQLRLTDIRPLAEIVGQARPQSQGAPLPQLLAAPHETGVVDVFNPQQVMDACEGMDAIINCTVIRKEAIGAFGVNTIGAYNIMRAAVAHGIRRVVQTGPFQMGRDGAAGYDWDTRIVEDVPARPGGFWDLYMHSKLAGQEICRIFAEHYGLEVPNLLFCNFVDPEKTPAFEINSFAISWQDAASAIAASLEASLPSPYEVLHINADLPHNVFPNDKAKRILGWRPQDDLRKFWGD